MHASINTGRKWTGARQTGFWRRLLWALVFPSRSQKVAATVPGLVLIGLSMAVGLAAYNTASNILFVTLALLLACLVLSGVLSWLNFRGVHWRLEVEAPMRAGREHPVALLLRNTKWFLPTYALSFEVSSSSQPKPEFVELTERLDAGAEAQLDWTVVPKSRGKERIEVSYVTSLFPFGFLKKSLAARTSCEVLVWPAPIEYRRFAASAWRRLQPGDPVARPGQNGDLLALRRYQAGDSHRQIHWKASARLRRLMVRQFAADSQTALTLHLDTSSSRWKEGEQFETLCSLATTLAEDLFKEGKLEAVAIDAEPPLVVRGLIDLEAFFDRLAMLKPGSETLVPPAGGLRRTKKNLLTFAPEGARGVSVFIDDEKAAAA